MGVFNIKSLIIIYFSFFFPPFFSFAYRFMPSQARSICEEVLTEYLTEKTYDEQECREWCLEMAETIKSRTRGGQFPLAFTSFLFFIHLFFSLFLFFFFLNIF